MMANKSTKIVVIVLATLAIITGLHMLLFRRTAVEYKNAKANYESIRGELEQLGRPKSWGDIFKFQYQSYNYEIKFLELIRDANLEYSDPFVVVASSAEEAKREQDKQMLLLWDMLHQLQDSAKASDKTKLRFLDNPRSWNLLPELPESVRRSGSAVSDLMRRLQDTDAVVKQVPEDSLLYREKELDYKRQLYGLGLNVIEREKMISDVGTLPAIYMTYNRIDLIKKETPKEELGGLKTEMEYNQRLWDLFRLSLKEVNVSKENEGAFLFNSYKQMVALQDLVKIAQDKGLAEIRAVKFWDARDIAWPPPELDPNAAAAAAAGMPGAAAMGMGAEGMGGIDPNTGEPLPGAMGMDGMAMDPYAGMGIPGAVGATSSAPATPQDIVAVAIPIEMQIVGSNSAVMAFLYEISHNRKSYSIDALDVISMSQQESAVGARVVIQVLSYYKSFETITAQEMTPTSQQINEGLARLLNQKKEIAAKPGADELARQEGFQPDQVPPPPGAAPAPAEAAPTPSPEPAPPPDAAAQPAASPAR